MKYEEALHEISTMVYRNTDDFIMRISKDCYKSIINALEKQIPKKPIPIYSNLYPFHLVTHKCPNCKTDDLGNNEYRFNYCEECGQALDWG